MIDYLDEESYAFHGDDRNDRCFLCRDQTDVLLKVRHVASMKMVHLCRPCMRDHFADYLLDNTRPWTGKRERT